MVAIPDQLLEAAGNFDLWAHDQMLRAEEEKKVTEPLYHYTDAAGLKGIIEKKEIWFTSHRYLNDPSELRFGIDAAHEAIKAISAKGPAKFFCDRLVGLFDVPTITEDLEYLLAGFSYERNDLGQWRAYGCNGHGFALGLAPHLFAVEQEKPGQKPNEKIGVYPVEYGRARARERHCEILEKAAEIFEDTWNKHKDDLLRDKTVALAFTDNYIRHVMAGALIFASLTSKHEAYQHEKEVRLMMLGLRTKFVPYIETRVRNDELVAFVRHPMPLIKEPGSIVEIVMGPCVGVEAEHAVRSLLNSSGIDPGVPIHHSAIPYRAR